MKVTIKKVTKEGTGFRAKVEFPNSDIIPVTAGNLAEFNRTLRYVQTRLEQRDEELKELTEGEYTVPEPEVKLSPEVKEPTEAELTERQIAELEAEIDRLAEEDRKDQERAELAQRNEVVAAKLAGLEALRGNNSR